MLAQWEVKPSAKSQYTPTTKPSYEPNTAFNKDKPSGIDKQEFTEKPKKIQSVNEIENKQLGNKYSSTVSEVVDADKKNV